MTAKLHIELSDEVLQLLVQQRSLTLTLTGGTPGRSPKPAADGAQREPREGSWPAKIIEWAAKRGKPFTTADVNRRFKKLSRAHASMVLSKLGSAGHPIRRVSRGLYEHQA